jgi:ABC-type multidrug transport system fused ATPase/permease subunit
MVELLKRLRVLFFLTCALVVVVCRNVCFFYCSAQVVDLLPVSIFGGSLGLVLNVFVWVLLVFLGVAILRNGPDFFYEKGKKEYKELTGHDLEDELED